MSDLLFDRQRAVLNELWTFIDEYCTAEKESAANSATARRAASHEGETGQRALTARHESELAELDESFADEEEHLTTTHKEEEEAARQSFAEAREQMAAAEREERQRLVAGLKDAQWLADSVAEAG